MTRCVHRLLDDVSGAVEVGVGRDERLRHDEHRRQTRVGVRDGIDDREVVRHGNDVIRSRTESRPANGGATTATP
jgi:hypothetical protein